MKSISKHYIDGAFVESHGDEIMDIIEPTRGTTIGHVTLADEKDARRAIAAAKEAFGTFHRTSKVERMAILRRLHEAVSARIGDLTDAMVEEYGGARRFAELIVEAGASVFVAIAPRPYPPTVIDVNNPSGCRPPAWRQQRSRQRGKHHDEATDPHRRPAFRP